ncbi:unnamed protein product, partial [Allacma fusca]
SGSKNEALVLRVLCSSISGSSGGWRGTAIGHYGGHCQLTERAARDSPTDSQGSPAN